LNEKSFWNEFKKRGDGGKEDVVIPYQDKKPTTKHE
jgi:hypothetical protein